MATAPTQNGARSPFLRVSEVAAELGICISATYGLIRSKELAASRFGTGQGGLRVSRFELDKFIEVRTTRPKQEAQQPAAKRRNRRPAGLTELARFGYQVEQPAAPQP